jgi:2,3-bisphosphoglycerate-dependent phosphoglycerate mutase
MSLILVRHSLPDIQPDSPATQWRLSEEGRKRCFHLAECLRSYDLQTFVSSQEPKAVETAHLAAARLGLTSKIATGLHEHERPGVGWTSREIFEAGVQDFFARPDKLVMGSETADQTYTRFASAVEAVLSNHADQNLAIVTHGTVISLFVSRQCKLEPYTLWKRLGMPAYIVFSVPEITLKNIVESIYPPL